jgi:hypothetical protein
MDSFLTYLPLISVSVVAGLFVTALVNFSTMRKNIQRQSEQQIKSLQNVCKDTRVGDGNVHCMWRNWVSSL